MNEWLISNSASAIDLQCHHLLTIPILPKRKALHFHFVIDSFDEILLKLAEKFS